MKKWSLHIVLPTLALLVIEFSPISSQAQTHYLLWYTPSTAEVINGIGIGPMNSGTKRDIPVRQTINGLQLELPGMGFLRFPFEDGGRSYFEGIGGRDKGVTVNGVLAAVAGSTGVDNINGVFVSAFCGFAQRVDGVSVNPLNFITRIDGTAVGIVNSFDEGHGTTVGIYNSSKDYNGLQIGLVNERKSGDGLQIGLINIKGGRILPFINF
jgi:hypothetical protein